MIEFSTKNERKTQTCNNRAHATGANDWDQTNDVIDGQPTKAKKLS